MQKTVFTKVRTHLQKQFPEAVSYVVSRCVRCKEKRRAGEEYRFQGNLVYLITIRICYQLSAGFRQISVKNKVVGEFFDPGAMSPAPQSMCPTVPL
jgi:hypothetical protein